jgi:type IV secretion system protein VirB11
VSGAAGAEPLAEARLRAALDHALGPAVLAALADPQVVEVLANPDGRLILDRQGAGRADSGRRLASADRARVIRLVADHVGEIITRDDPRLAGVLPGGERFQGWLPPVCAAPAYAIRKRPGRIFTLGDYVAQGAATARQADILRQAARERRNLLISGGTGSGKTTLANAVLADPAFAQDRVVLIEDVPELQCSAWDLVAVVTRRAPRPIGVADLVRDALRMRPDRIVIGEMRDGWAALDTLKAWNTGHPGGLSTLHANSAPEAIARLEDLLAEATARPVRRLIDQAVDLVVHIERAARGRRIAAVLRRDAAGRLQAVD